MHGGRVTGSEFVNSESFLPVHRNIARQLPSSLRFAFGSFLFSARSAGVRWISICAITYMVIYLVAHASS